MNRGPKIVNVVFALLSLMGALVAGSAPHARSRITPVADVEMPRGVEETGAAVWVPDLETPCLEYPFDRGYIHNWLVAGPQAIAIEEPYRPRGEGWKTRVARYLYEANSGITQPPAEAKSFDLADNTKLTWRYHRALDDHFVDLSGTYEWQHYLRAWAYARIASPASQQATWILTTDGPADVWLNGQHVHRQERFGEQGPQSATFEAVLQAGQNEVLVRFEQVAGWDTPYAMAMRVDGLPADETSVVLPTAAQNPNQRRALETLLDRPHLEQDVYHKGNEILLRWPENLSTGGRYTYQIQDSRNRIYLDGSSDAALSRQVDAGHYARFWEGDYHFVLGPLPFDYYEQNLRYQRRMPIHIVDNAFSEEPYGTYEERRQEALADAARRDDGLFSEIARLALGQWSNLDLDRIAGIAAEIDQYTLSSAHVVGLLGLLYRYAEAPAFPEPLRRDLDGAILESRYWVAQPASDAPAHERLFYHTGQILAGQRYPDHRLGATGHTGRWHRRQGERAVLAWLNGRAASGLGGWESSTAIEAYAVALSHLADLAESDRVRQLAAEAMDRVFLWLAHNSYRGVFGAAHGDAATPPIKSGRLAPTAGISRLLWGMGIYNRHLMGTVSMACADYDLPPAIYDAAVAPSEATRSRERHAVGIKGTRWWSAGRPAVNKVTYRTADYMLSSAQDYRPGERGAREHIWQATLGPDAVVFVNHPSSAHEQDARSSGFWVGNRVLPRVAQWKDTLIAIHSLPKGDWMGFTHARFPVYAFDEYTIHDGWAFARQGDGYLALTASQGIELVTRGPGAYRELRSYGGQNVWLCMMGQRATDGSFNDFQEAVLGLDVRSEGLDVRTHTLRGETLSFGWKGALRVNGRVERVTGFAPTAGVWVQNRGRLGRSAPDKSGDPESARRDGIC